MPEKSRVREAQATDVPNAGNGRPRTQRASTIPVAAAPVASEDVQRMPDSAAERRVTSPQSEGPVSSYVNRLYISADSENALKQRIRVLVAGDESSCAHQLSEQSSNEDCSWETALTRDTALDIVRKAECDVVVCEMPMRGVNRFELLEQMKVLQPHLPVILRTSDGSITEAVEAIKLGAYQYLAAPFNENDLAEFVVQAWTESRQDAKTARPPRMTHGVLSGELEHVSPIMRELVQSIALVARSNAPVLILGESGTGKERVARAIHEGGARASQPFVPVNTSAIPDALLESEVFGHVRGAFTGATQARRGLLAEANGGTLLLDEIGDMPIALQPKLLRVLQFGEVRQVGSDRFGHVDVRVIAATHRDLSILVGDGRFREDLRYRLNVIALVVPPLRERREDIAPLARKFLEEARQRTPESPVERIGDEAMNVLMQAGWPGNVRELENAIERVVVLGRNDEIGASDLAFLHQGAAAESLPDAGLSQRTLKQMNRQYLDSVLASTGGDKVRAAGILNIDLSTLYRWVRAKD